MEAFRSFGIAGEEARCGVANCSFTDDFFLNGKICANQDDLPSNVLANTDSEGQYFEERACCTPTEEGATAAPFVTAEEDTCIAASLAKKFGQSDDKNLAAIIGGTVGGAVFLMLVAGAGYFYTRRGKRLPRSLPMASATAVEEAPVNVTAMDVMQSPPTNPEASAPVAGGDHYE